MEWGILITSHEHEYSFMYAQPADVTLNGAGRRVDPDDGVDKDVLHPERAIGTGDGVARATLGCWQVVESEWRCRRCGEGELSH